MGYGCESWQPEYCRMITEQWAQQIREQRDDDSQNEGCEKALQLLTMHLYFLQFLELAGTGCVVLSNAPATRRVSSGGRATNDSRLLPA